MKLYYYEHSADSKRIRRDDWPNDMWSVVTEGEFKTVELVCGMLGVPLIDGDLEELEEESRVG